MSDSPIGIELDTDTLVLTRGRDFKWSFENLDTSVDPKGVPVDFPAGDLFFEIQTGGENNSTQIITQSGTASGSYWLTLDTDISAELAYDSAEAVVQGAIEALPGVGAGNVEVTASYIPEWFFEVNFNAALHLSPLIIQAFTAAMDVAFAGVNFFASLAGVHFDIQGSYAPNQFTATVTLQGSLLEQEFANIAITAMAAAVQTALGAVSIFTGKIASVVEFYAPIRTFHVEFVNGKKWTPVSKLVPTTTQLTGHNPKMSVDQISPGKSPVTLWHLDIAGSIASLKVESENADLIQPRTLWQLVFLPEGEAAGGDPVALGRVHVQGAAR